jgi:hypothetical protein
MEPLQSATIRIVRSDLSQPNIRHEPSEEGCAAA